MPKASCTIRFLVVIVTGKNSVDSGMSAELVETTCVEQLAESSSSEQLVEAASVKQRNETSNTPDDFRQDHVNAGDFG